jgi:carbon-monoxide dehydrogenase medium subunit
MVKNLMKPPPFSYHDPRTIPDAVALLGRLENAKLLAGGQSLMPMLNMRFVLPDHIIDLNQVEGLAFIRESNGALEIGAMTRQRDLEFSDLIRQRCPLMHEAILNIGHRQTRNRGTLGGSLCHLDPSAELVSVATALDATVTAQGPNGTREIAIDAFPVAYMTPAIELNEIVTAARFPLWPQPHGYGFVEFARRHGDFAIVSAAALITEDAAGKITRASVTLGGMGAAPVRAREVELALIGNRPDDALLREICESCRAFEAVDDVHAPANYRQQLATVMSRRALEQARARLPSMATAH